jgi:hypothetical protein
MVTIKVKGGTPAGVQSLCTTCRWAHIVKGSSASQKVVRCGRFYYDPRVIPFSVSECSSYDDKRIPSVGSMEQIAWILLTKKTGRHIGFVTAKQFHQIEGDDAEIVPAASVDATKKEE